MMLKICRLVCLLVVTYAVSSVYADDDVALDVSAVPDLDLDADYDQEPLGDIEEELDELIEQAGDDDVDADDDEDDVTEERRQVSGRHRQNIRQAVRKITRFMHRHNVSDVDDVPGRKFGAHLRRIHNQRRRTNDDDVSDSPGRRHRKYDHVLRAVERRTSVPSANFNRVCGRLATRTTPPRRRTQQLPAQLQQQFTQMFQTRRAQLTECCEQTGEERSECFEDAYESKQDSLCVIQLQLDQVPMEYNTMFLRMMSSRQECCQILDPDERGDCFKRAGRQVRRRHRRPRRSVDSDDDDIVDITVGAERRAVKMCRKLEGIAAQSEPSERRAARLDRMDEADRQEHEERMREAVQCCQQEDAASASCLQELKMRRLASVCTDQQVTQGRGTQFKQRLRDTCCHLNTTQKETCFEDIAREHLTNKLASKLQNRHNRREHRRDERRENRREGRRENRDERRENRRENRQEERRESRDRQTRSIKRQRESASQSMDTAPSYPLNTMDMICARHFEQPDWLSERFREHTTELRGGPEHRMVRHYQRMMSCCQLEYVDRLRCMAAMQRSGIDDNACDITTVDGEQSETERMLREQCCQADDASFISRRECFRGAMRRRFDDDERHRALRRQLRLNKQA